MGLMKSLLTSQSNEEDSNYIELTDENLKDSGQAAEYSVKIAELRGQQDMMAIKDAIYNEHILFVDFSEAEVNGVNLDLSKERLKEAVDEINGDIVETGQTFIITPAGVRISREKLK